MHAFYFVFFFHMDAIAKGIFLLFNVHLIQCLMPITLTLWEGLQITINNGVGRGGYVSNRNCDAESVGEYNKIIFGFIALQYKCFLTHLSLLSHLKSSYQWRNTYSAEPTLRPPCRLYSTQQHY